MTPPDQGADRPRWYTRPTPIFFLSMASLSGAYLLLSLQLPIGTISRVGPGAFPVLVGALGLVMSIAGLLGVRTAGATPPAAPDPGLEAALAKDEDASAGTPSDTSSSGFLARHGRPLLFLLVMLAYPMTVELVGHFPAAFLVCLGVLVLARRRSLLSAVIWALVLSAAFTLLFAALGVRLPQGVLGFLGDFGL